MNSILRFNPFKGEWEILQKEVCTMYYKVVRHYNTEKEGLRYLEWEGMNNEIDFYK